MKRWGVENKKPGAVYMLRALTMQACSARISRDPRPGKSGGANAWDQGSSLKR